MKHPTVQGVSLNSIVAPISLYYKDGCDVVSICNVSDVLSIGSQHDYNIGEMCIMILVLVLDILRTTQTTGSITSYIHINVDIHVVHVMAT
jgi:hypothetical protein